MDWPKGINPTIYIYTNWYIPRFNIPCNCHKARYDYRYSMNRW